MSITEWIGAITCLLCIWLAARQNVWTWPVALVSVSAYFIFFYQIKLYADMLLQVFFLISNLYGWYEWKRGGQGKTELPVTWLSHIQTVGVILAGVGCSILLAWYFRKFTDAAYPAVDSTLAAFSVVAQILLTRKKIENWIIWFVADVVYVWLYFTKGAYVTAGVYLILVFLAVQGFYEWRKSSRTA